MKISMENNKNILTICDCGNYLLALSPGFPESSSRILQSAMLYGDVAVSEY